ncbi:SGNH/GDSL hydrolase family protein [Fulvivirga sediminis]|uniref:SGNH/GDSL hydrolase family protein n=1 Tax=Fulvivirga sediminis TaxID=2803949 RepID=A0A937FAV8_9BACT|nr:SGNH/GDSL hydrolase family protein [Fulvivirga sediminis]MBL3657495.1 SGNH/GDSL hydrolase family protein [Fulvivirga sediminis]
MFLGIILLTFIACTSDNDMTFTASNPAGDTLNQSLTFLALGDSYTIGESVSEAQRWPVQLVNAINAKGFHHSFEQPNVVARTGWTTQELQEGIAAHNLNKDYDLVSLLIGVNNQYRGQSVSTYQAEFRTLLQQAIGFAGGRIDHVIVLSIPDYGYTPFGANKKEEISKAIDDYNAVNEKITDELGVRYYDITPISRTDDPHMVAGDGLHPSGKQYEAWVELILTDFRLQKWFE